MCNLKICLLIGLVVSSVSAETSHIDFWTGEIRTLFLESYPTAEHGQEGFAEFMGEIFGIIASRMTKAADPEEEYEDLDLQATFDRLKSSLAISYPTPEEEHKRFEYFVENINVLDNFIRDLMATAYFTASSLGLDEYAGKQDSAAEGQSGKEVNSEGKDETSKKV